MLVTVAEDTGVIVLSFIYCHMQRHTKTTCHKWFM